MSTNPRTKSTYRVRYSDGEVVTGLDFETSLSIFMQSRTTDRPCTVTPDEADFTYL